MKKYKQTEDGLLIKNISTEDMGVYSCWAEMAEEATFEEEKILVDVFSAFFHFLKFHNQDHCRRFAF